MKKNLPPWPPMPEAEWRYQSRVTQILAPRAEYLRREQEWQWEIGLVELTAGRLDPIHKLRLRQAWEQASHDEAVPKVQPLGVWELEKPEAFLDRKIRRWLGECT